MDGPSNVLLLLAVCAAGQVIRDDPSDVTVFLDDTALFTCLIEVGYIKWRVNDTDSDDLTNAIQSDLATHNTSVSGLYLFALTIQGRVEYNRTRIQCVTRSQDNNLIHTSETALLSIQGVLAPVDNLTTSSNTSSITISWTAPYSLDVTNVKYDIWYSLLIDNVTAAPTAVSCIGCINITETHYTFTPNHPSPCHKYNFTVYPLNGAGQGPPSHIGKDKQAPSSIIVSEESITVSKISNKYLVVITAVLFSDTTVFCSISVHFESSQQGCPEAVSVVYPQVSLPDNALQIKSEVQLGSSCNYSVTIVLSNEAGKTNSTPFSISTTVIMVDIQQLNGGVAVRCIFQHTLSQICYVQLVGSASGGFHEGICLQGERQASHMFTGLVSSTYTVLVYGLRRDEASCSLYGDPDYITIVDVAQPTSVTPHPSITHRTNLASESTSNALCIEGLGVGIGVGAVTMFTGIVISIIIVKIVSRWKSKLAHSATHKRKVTMEENVAYELHVSRWKRKQVQSLTHKEKVALKKNVAYEPYNPMPHGNSQQSTAIYEDLQ